MAIAYDPLSSASTGIPAPPPRPISYDVASGAPPLREPAPVPEAAPEDIGTPVDQSDLLAPPALAPTAEGEAAPTTAPSVFAGTGPQQSWSFSDLGNTFMSEVYRLGAGGAALQRRFAVHPEVREEAKAGEKYAGRMSSYEFSKMTPGGQAEASKALPSSIGDIPGYLAFKGVGMAPALIAMAPAGFLEGAVALGAVAVANGAIGSAEATDRLYGEMDKLSDGEFMARSSEMQRLVKDGMPVADARVQIENQLIGMKPLVIAGIDAVAGVAGPGVLLKGLPPQLRPSSLVLRVPAAAAAGTVAGGGQAAATAIAAGDVSRKLGLPEPNVGEEVASGALVNGILTMFGGFHKGEVPPAGRVRPGHPEVVTGISAEEAAALQPPAGAAAEGAPPPPPGAAAGATEGAPPGAEPPPVTNMPPEPGTAAPGGTARSPGMEVVDILDRADAAEATGDDALAAQLRAQAQTILQRDQAARAATPPAPGEAPGAGETAPAPAPDRTGVAAAAPPAEPGAEAPPGEAPARPAVQEAPPLTSEVTGEAPPVPPADRGAAAAEPLPLSDIGGETGRPVAAAEAGPGAVVPDLSPEAPKRAARILEPVKREEATAGGELAKKVRKNVKEMEELRAKQESEAALAAKKESGVTGPAVARESKQGAALKAANKERVTALSKAFTASEPQAWEPPKQGDAAALQTLRDRVYGARQAILATGREPLKKIHASSDDMDLWGRETLRLAEAFDKTGVKGRGKISQNKLDAHIKEYTTRLKSAVGDGTGKPDFTQWRKERFAAGEAATFKGGGEAARQAEIAAIVGEETAGGGEGRRVGAGGAGTGQAEKAPPERAEATGVERIIPKQSAEAKAIAARALAALEKRAAPKEPEKIAGKAGITAGKKGEEVVAKAKAKAKAEAPAPPKEEPKPAAIQSHTGIDEKQVALAADVARIARELGEEKAGGRKAQLAKELAAARERFNHYMERGAARTAKRAEAEAPPAREGRPDEAAIALARRDHRHWGERVATLKERGAPAEEIATAQKRLDAARDVLRAAGQLGPEIDRQMVPRTRLAQLQVALRSRDLVGTLNKVVRTLGRGQPTRTHIVTNDAGVKATFHSYLDSTVSKVFGTADRETLARRTLGSSEPEAVAVIDRIHELTGDTPVYFVDQAHTPWWEGNDDAGFVSGADGDFIMINVRAMHENLQEGISPADAFNHMQRVTVHEAMHAFTARMIKTNDKVRAQIEALMGYVETEAMGEYHYGLENAQEFVAEAFSNRKFQELLRDTILDPEIARRLGLHDISPRPSVWDAFVGYVRQLFGVPKSQHSAFDAIARIVSEHEAEGITSQVSRRRTGPLTIERLIRPGEHMRRMGDWARRAGEHIVENPAPEDQHGVPWGLKLVTGDYLARAADRFFGRATNPVRRVMNALNAVRVTSANELGKALPLIKRLYDAQRTMPADAWNHFVDLLHDETTFGVFADKALTDRAHAYLGKDSLRGAQAKGRWADLNERWQQLDPRARELRDDLQRFYRLQQNKLTVATIRNRLLRAADINPDTPEGAALANRIFLGRMTEADETALGSDLATLLKQTNVLKKLDGPYYPLMRRGDWVVRGKYRVPEPSAGSSAKRVTPEAGQRGTIWEFGAGPNANKAQARKAAMDYAGSLPMKASVKSVWVDETTGRLFVEDDESAPIKVLRDDPNSDQRFRVYVQDEHMELVENRRVAERRRAELANHPDLESVERVARRRENDFPGSGWLSSQVRTLEQSLENRAGFQAMPTAAKIELRQALREASVRLLSSTRIESRSLPRRYVAGASRDVVANALDYARATTGRLARLQHGPELDKALDQLDQQAGASHPQTLGRSSIANEVHRRVNSNTGLDESNQMTRGLQRWMLLNFTTDLAGPSWTAINLTQVPMLTMPILSARHGAIRTWSAARKAYRDVGALRTLSQGLKQTGRALTGRDTEYSYFDRIRETLPADEQRLFDAAAERGVLDPEVGLEVGNAVDLYHGATPFSEVVNKADAALNFTSTVARQLPRATEIINRGSALLMAYRLEKGRGATHEAAMEYALDTVNATQFHYASVNRAPIFNNPLARLMFQFKQYPIGVMQLIAENVGKGIRNLEPGDRLEATKAVAGIMARHAVMAGVLGLPTEPIKIFMVALGAMGLPVPSWRQMEDFERRAAANLLGEWGGRAVSLGLPAALGVDVSQRVGLSSGFFFGQPQAGQSGLEWAALNFMGAPYSNMENYTKGVGHLINGEFEQGAEQLIPIKAVSSLMRAYRETVYGKVSGSGRQTLEPYSIPEAIIRGLGFTPTRESETATRIGLFAERTGRTANDRQALMNEWYAADPGRRMRMMGDIQAWNKNHPPEERLTLAHLNDYTRRRQREQITGGARMASRADQARMQELLPVYGQ